MASTEDTKINADEFLKDTRPALESIVKNNNSEIGRVVAHDLNNRSKMSVYYFGLGEEKETFDKDVVIVKGNLVCNNDCYIDNTERELNSLIKTYKNLPNTIFELQNEHMKKYE